MAQLVLTLAGGVLGGGIAGGLGQSLGALFGAYVGGILDRELFGPQQDRRPVEGSRLTELISRARPTARPWPVVWGRMRVPANIIWLRGIREVVRTETKTVEPGAIVLSEVRSSQAPPATRDRYRSPDPYPPRPTSIS